MPVIATPFRKRMAPRSGMADRLLDWESEARIATGELVSPVLMSLRGAALRVYFFLRARAFENEGNTVDNFGYKSIAAYTTLNWKTVKRAVEDLVDAGLLLVRRRWGLDVNWNQPGDLPNEYTVLKPADAEAAFERKRRIKAGEKVAPIAVPLVQIAEPDPTIQESAAELAARLSEAAARALVPAIEAQEAALVTARETLQKVPAFNAPTGWQRFRHIDAAQDCIHAIRAREHAARALGAAEHQLSFVAGALRASDPGKRGWVWLLAEIRLVLGQAGAVIGLVAEAAKAAERAKTTWGAVIAPQRLDGQGVLSFLRPSETGPARPTAGPWEPPPGWFPVGRRARSAWTWMEHRTLWKLAQGQPDGPEVQARLRGQGFDPDWPDPPPLPKPTGKPKTG